MRVAPTVISIAIALVAAACTIGGVNALPPHDAGEPGVDGGDDVGPDAGAPDAQPCEPGVDTDGDAIEDCTEVADGDPFTDPAVFNGLTAMIGERPEITGTCNSLDDRAEMESRFASPVRTLDVYAGWEFDTNADDYADPSYGFMPNWTESDSGRFSVRYRGQFNAATAGIYCFNVDIGASGTDIFSGKNMCAQVYVGDGASFLVETGYEAEGPNADEACIELAEGAHTFDIVFWYFNILEQAVLVVRHCRTDAGTCTPDAPIAPEQVQAIQE